MMSLMPQLRASAVAPTIPPITPECVTETGSRAAAPKVQTPPLPCMMKGAALTPLSRMRCSRLPRCSRIGRLMKALMQVVLVRSYSRNSRTTSEDRETSTSGQTCAASSAIRRSCAGLT